MEETMERVIHYKDISEKLNKIVSQLMDQDKTINQVLFSLNDLIKDVDSKILFDSKIQKLETKIKELNKKESVLSVNSAGVRTLVIDANEFDNLKKDNSKIFYIASVLEDHDFDLSKDIIVNRDPDSPTKRRLKQLPHDITEKDLRGYSDYKIINLKQRIENIFTWSFLNKDS